MESLPLEIGDVVAVTISGLQMLVLSTGLKMGESRAMVQGYNLETTPMIGPSGGPNDTGVLLVCGPTQVVKKPDDMRIDGFTGPEICVSVALVEAHYPQPKPDAN